MKSSKDDRSEGYEMDQCVICIGTFRNKVAIELFPDKDQFV